jgi:hypothetical protein
VVVEGGWVFPSFAEGVFEVADYRASHLELYVVPRRSWAVAGRDIDSLEVAGVARIVVATVAQVDPARVRDVTIGSFSASDDYQLLMVAAAATHTLVEEHLAACLVHGLGESDIVLFCEVCLARV